jgi:hypothetical protein
VTVDWIRVAYSAAFPGFTRSSLFATLLLFAPVILRAIEPTTDPTTAEQLKQLNDRTIIATHLSLDSEWNQFKHGAQKASWTLEGLWAWPVSDSQDWGIRFKSPFVYDRSDAASGHVETGGLGDAELGAGTAFRLSKTWRTAGGIELHGDTASDRALAENVWRLKPGWGIAHDVTHWFSFTLNAEYNHSIAERHDVRHQSYFELASPVTFILPHNWAMNANYKATVDFENDDRWTQTISAGVAKRLTNVPLVLSATFEKPLSGDPKKFQASVTIVYYFQRYHSPKKID